MSLTEEQTHIRMAPATKGYLTIARIAYTLSVALACGWVYLGTSEYSLLFQIMMLPPIFAPAIGIFKGKPYTHAWSGFIASLYLLSSATSWWVYPDERTIATTSIVALMSWLLASTYFAKLRGKELGLGLKKLKTQH